MLARGQIKGIDVKSCYCCSTEGRVAFIVEAPNRDTVLEALEKIDVPIASILEAEEVTPKM